MRSLKNVKKLSDFTRSQLLELVGYFGGDDGGMANALSVLKHEKRIKLEDISESLFTQYGLASSEGLDVSHAAPERLNIRISSLKMISAYRGYVGYIQTFWNLFAGRAESFGRCVKITEFDKLLFELLDLLSGSSRVHSMQLTPWLPIVLPRYGDKPEGYATIYNRWIKLLSNQIARDGKNSGTPIDEYPESLSSIRVNSASRHDKLFKLLHRRSVVGVYFPFVFQGWSSESANDFVDNLPAGFALSGALDTIVAGLTYPDVLFSDFQHSYVMSGVQIKDQEEFVAPAFHVQGGGVTLALSESRYRRRLSAPGLTFIKPWRKWDK